MVKNFEIQNWNIQLKGTIFNKNVIKKNCNNSFVKGSTVRNDKRQD